MKNEEEVYCPSIMTILYQASHPCRLPTSRSSYTRNLVKTVIFGLRHSVFNADSEYLWRDNQATFKRHSSDISSSGMPGYMKVAQVTALAEYGELAFPFLLPSFLSPSLC